MFPVPTRRYSILPPFNRYVVELNSTTALVTTHHTTYTFADTGGGPWQMRHAINFESPFHLRFSPRRDRAIIQGSARAEGMLVYDATTGDTAYGLPAVTTLGAAAVSADGSQFTMTGQATYSEFASVVLTVDATTGATLRQTRIPHFSLGISRDPIQDRL